MTSHGLDVARRPAAPAAVAATTGQASAVPSFNAPQRRPQQMLIYYLVDSMEQWELIDFHARADAVYVEEIGSTSIERSYHFILAATWQEEAEANRLLRYIADTALLHGIIFQVVDLR